MYSSTFDEVVWFWAKNGFGNSRLLYICSFGLNFDVPVYIFVGTRFGFGDVKMLIKLRNRSLKLILVIQRSFILGIMTNQLIKLRKIQILEVDLSYPDELHSSHNDHPFNCDSISVLLPSSTVGKKEIDLLNKICANTFFHKWSMFKDNFVTNTLIQ